MPYIWEYSLKNLLGKEGPVLLETTYAVLPIHCFHDEKYSFSRPKASYTGVWLCESEWQGACACVHFKKKEKKD